MKDSEIVDLYFLRDEEAIRMTETKYGAMLQQIAFRILGCWEDAEECVNDAYFEAWRRIPPNDPRDYLKAFLGSIVRHLAIDRCRFNNRKRRVSIYNELSEESEECLPAKEGIEEVIDGKILTDMIEAYLKECETEKRVMFVKRYWLCESISEISLEHRVSENKVKVTLSRMRGKLREYLIERGYEL
ncbi:MAG: RNA polymerase sigma factor [Lachnospiraceae bacterium]|nr:RNA polymerase sigma factor [Lachnospiraceae bacterium]